MRVTLKNSTGQNVDTIAIKYRGLRKTVVGPVRTPSLVRLSHVLGVNYIKCWYDHFFFLFHKSTAQVFLLPCT